MAELISMSLGLPAKFLQRLFILLLPSLCVLVSCVSINPDGSKTADKTYLAHRKPYSPSIDTGFRTYAAPNKIKFARLQADTLLALSMHRKVIVCQWAAWCAGAGPHMRQVVAELQRIQKAGKAVVVFAQAEVYPFQAADTLYRAGFQGVAGMIDWEVYGRNTNKKSDRFIHALGGERSLGFMSFYILDKKRMVWSSGGIESLGQVESKL